jgi:Ca2+-binding RTX toxin-like protein
MLIALVGALILWTQPARAAATCASVGVNVNITLAAGDNVTIARDAAGNFSVSGTSLVATNCGGATVANRDTVNVTGAGGNESVTIDLTNGQFAPGVVDEPGGTDEIEFVANLGAGSADAIVLSGSAAADQITLGETGINLNDGDDSDIATTDIEVRTVSGAGGDDVLSAGGGNATGAPASYPVTVNGGNGADTITGGDAADTLNGDADADMIAGGLGADTLSGNIGNDTFLEGAGANGSDSFAGGTGADAVTYAGRTNAVTGTLDGVFDDGEAGEGDSIGADVENVTGGSGNDVLVGSASPNVLNGGNGADVIDAASGTDTVDGGGGGDDIIGGPSNDALSGGAGTDTADFVQSTTTVTASLSTGTATAPTPCPGSRT